MNDIIKVEDDGSVVIPLEAFWRSVKDELPELTETHESIVDCSWSKDVLMSLPSESHAVIGFYEEASKGNPSGPYCKWFKGDELEEQNPTHWMYLPDKIDGSKWDR